MPETLLLCMDDSGTRKPNYEPAQFVSGKRDAFALGGVLIKGEDEQSVRDAYAEFTNSWKINYPLHSVDIRYGKANFGWLRGQDPDVREAFLANLEKFLLSLPLLAIACVIDRPGYDARYRESYGRQQWHLCQTAFCILVERATKHAIRLGRKLRVYPERCSKKDDARLMRYYESMRSTGLPFEAAQSANYQSLDPGQLRETLYELAFKYKSSPLAQLADLYLWPQVMAGYGEYRPMARIREAGRDIDSVLNDGEIGVRGIKYSCFELVRAAGSKSDKGPAEC